MELSKSALNHNVRYLRGLLPKDSFFCPMVKANAYGHDDVLISRELETIGVKHLGVVTSEEAFKLRDSGIKADILVYGSYETRELQKFHEQNITPVISRLEQLDELNKIKLKGPQKIHVKFNTGMNRLGLSVEQVSEVMSRLTQSLVLEGVCSHLLNADDLLEKNGYSVAQVRLFQTTATKLKTFTPALHLFNSASLLLKSEYSGEQKSFIENLGARPGLTIYGLSPLGKNSQLRPVMSVVSQIEHIQHVKSGEVVSYGARWKAKRDSIIGIVPIGYADGYARSLTNKSQMLVGGHKVPTVGTVCMDYVMVDLTDVPLPERGARVTVIGQDMAQRIDFHDLANVTETIPYEFMTRIGNRLSRSWIEDE